MATFVLVHGTWHASWCWRRVTTLLERRGHRAIAVDLPGQGADKTALNEITLRHYVDAVSDAIVGAVDTSGERPIAVVHSMGGLLATVAEARPDDLEAVVFIAANLPPAGSSMLAVVEQYDPGFPATFVWAADGRSAGITADGVRHFLYNCCPSSIVDEVLPRFTPAPVAPFEAVMTLTDERFGRVPRYFIETLQDRAVPLRLQRSIQARLGFKRVFTLDADHAPFFSAPEELA
jgi:pimeloyl-ACP methyl ester carboxylesterase